MLLFTAETPPITSPLIQIVIEQQKEEVEPQVIEKIYTIEEKIESNFYECDESIQYIRADDATCLAKPVYTQQNTRSTVRQAVNGSNSYTYGYCTWHVKNLLSWVPNGLGNANTWASRARSQGYTVSNTPIVGAVAQTSGGRLGHVAVVTSVNGATITVAEMNYTGWNVASTRTAPTSSFVYIY
jgi:surface antigen